MIDVEHQQDRVADDRLAVFVYVDFAAEELHAQAAHEGILPGLIIHLLAGRVEPGDFGGFRPWIALP